MTLFKRKSLRWFPLVLHLQCQDRVIFAVSPKRKRPFLSIIFVNFCSCIITLHWQNADYWGVWNVHGAGSSCMEKAVSEVKTRYCYMNTNWHNNSGTSVTVYRLFSICFTYNLAHFLWLLSVFHLENIFIANF